MEQKSVHRCDTKIDADACKASYAIKCSRLCIGKFISQTYHNGYKVCKQLDEFFCPEQAGEVWAQESGQISDVGAGVRAAIMRQPFIWALFRAAI